MERSVQSDQFIVWNGIQNATEAVTGVPLIVCQHPAYPVGVAVLIALLGLRLHAASGRSFHDLQIKLQSTFSRNVFGTAAFKRFGNAGLDKKVWQYFTVVPDFKSVGVRDNARSFEWPVIIRAVNTVDAMTATIEPVDWPILMKITDRILKEVKNVNRVCYDMSPKPNATIEWE